MNLSEFVKGLRADIDSFCVYWAEHAGDQDWPMKLDQAEWEEQFILYCSLLDFGAEE